MFQGKPVRSFVRGLKGCEMSVFKKQKMCPLPSVVEKRGRRSAHSVKIDDFVLVYTDPSLEEGVFTWPLTQASTVVGFGPGNYRLLRDKCALLPVIASSGFNNQLNDSNMRFPPGQKSEKQHRHAFAELAKTLG
jgi:hypothetical protein